MRDLSPVDAAFSVVSGRSSVVRVADYAQMDGFSVIGADGALDGVSFVVVQRGDDLVVIYADGTEVIIEDYFLSNTIAVFDTGVTPVELGPLVEPIGTIGDDALYGYSGPVDEVRAIILDRADIAPLEPFLSDDDGGIASFAGNLAGLGWGGFAAAAVANAVSGSSALLGGLAAVTTVISGKFVAGPIVPGNGLVVDVYDALGNLLLSDVPLDANGSFSVTLPGTVPNVIAILRDTNAAPDYRDEATGGNVDLNANLAGIGVGVPQPGGTTTVSLNINPVTTVAARLAGVGANGTIPQGGITPEAITQSLATVQNSFGVSDLNGVPPIDIFDPDFNDTDGNISDGERYGQVLAMLSGKDKLNGGNQQTTIDELVTSLQNAGGDSTAQQSAVRTELLEGAREFEFNNTSGTQTEADLLGSPSLGVERTPEVGTDGNTTEPSFANLLEDALEGTSTGDGANPNADTITGFQTLVDTADAVQALAALDTGAGIPQALIDQLTEENLTALGLTGLTAPSPYLDQFLDALRDVATEDADTVQELQDLFDGVVAANLLPPTITTSNADTLSGTAEPNSTVTLTLADNSTVTATADGSGNYAFSPNPVPNGQTATLTATDAAGNVSAPTTVPAVDATDPNPPTITTSNADTLSGTAEPNSTVTLTLADNSTVTATADGSGNYAFSPNPVPNGQTATLTATDAAGNVSAPTTVPAVDATDPTLTITTPIEGDNVVSAAEDNDVVVQGTTDAEDGRVVTVVFTDSLNATVTATATVTGGNWSLAGADISGLAEGAISVSATVSDAAGNAATPATATVTLNNTPPAAPTINQGITDQANTVSGTGEAGATLTLFNGGTQIGTTTVASDGTWSLITAAPVADGAVLTARQTDAQNNESPLSAGVTTFTDTDGDGIRNSLDTDDDGDGIADATEQPQTVFTENFDNLTGDVEITSTGTPWVFTGISDTDSGGGTPNSFYAYQGKLQFFRNPAQQTLTQNFTDMTGGSSITVNMAIRSSLPNSATLEILYEGVVYATIDTTTPNNVVFSNGASGSWGGSTDLATLSNLVVNLPVSVPNSGTVTLRYTTTAFDADDIDISSITVSKLPVLGDIDGDGVVNIRDRDTDGDRIWDEFEPTTDGDGDGRPDYRDTDSNGAGVGDDTSNASLTAAQITALEGGGTYANGFILLSEAVTLDFTAIPDSGVFTSDVEYIDMRDGANAQVVILNEAEVINLTDGNNELILIGDGNDSVTATGFVGTGKDQSIDGRSFSIYEAGTATLFIDDEIGTITLT